MATNGKDEALDALTQDIDPSDKGADPADAGGDDDFGGATEEDISYAQMQGWVGKKDWRGAPEEWVTAKEFASKARGINPILRSNNQKLITQLSEIQKDMNEWKEMTRKQVRKEIEAEVAQARADRAVAISDADPAKFDDAETRLEAAQKKLEKHDAAETTPAKPNGDALPATKENQEAAAAWVKRNPWSLTDRRRATIYGAIGEEVRSERPDLVGNVAEYLKECDRRAIRDYPQMFTTRGRSNSNADSTRTSSSDSKGNGRKRTFDDLPAEAKTVCDRMVKNKMIKTRQDYVDNFNFSE